MAGSGLAVGICKEAHENLMSHKSISQWPQRGGMECIKVKFWPFAVKEEEYVLHIDDILNLSWSWLG